MKLKRIFVFCLLFLNIIFFNLVDVKAALPSTIGPIDQVGSKLTDNLGFGVHLKVGSGYAAICTDYYKDSPANSTKSCTLTSNWSDRIRYSVAAVINEAKSKINTSSVTSQYFAAEMAINVFLRQKDVGASSLVGHNLANGYPSSGDYYNAYSTYLNIANTAYNNYSSTAKVNITLSSSNLNFILVGTNYESNSITVSGVSDYTVTSNVGSVSKSGNSFKVIVPVSTVSSVTSVTATVKSSKTINQARNYNCGDAYQSVTPVALETKNISDEEQAIGNISPKAKLIINKYDENNKPLSGAVIKVTGPNGYTKTVTTAGTSITIDNLAYGSYTVSEVTAPSGYSLTSAKTVLLSINNLSSTVNITNSKNEVIISKVDVTGSAELPGATLQIKDETGKTIHEWVSTTEPHRIKGLALGKYYLVETIAPSGYVLNQEKVAFEITATTSTQSVKMENKLNSIKFIKIDDSTNKPLPGATLEIQDEKGNVVKYCTDKDGNKNTECKWISTKDAYEVKGLPKGTYYLVETEVPAGYVLSKEKVKFTITETTETKTVTMKNELNKVIISKLSAVDKKELPGATLEIQDEKGNIVKYCTDEKGNTNTVCKWVSTKEPREIEGLPNGTYYLVETIAPKGYVLNKEKVKFIIDGSKTTYEVEMLNNLEIEVPDTLSSKSNLIIAIAMVLISIGIGIITYVKKHRLN